MNQATIDKLKANPHYKPTPGQIPVEDAVEDIDEEKELKKNPVVKTFGVIPKQDTTTIPKRIVKPALKTHN
jgi:hypothetical protein